MPAVVYEQNFNDNPVIRIINTADPSKEYGILLSIFERGKTIESCEELSGSIGVNGTLPPDTPWWMLAARDYLFDLYESKQLTSTTHTIVHSIRHFKIVDGNQSSDITKEDMRKIADAMCWLHQNYVLSQNAERPIFGKYVLRIRALVYSISR